MTSGSTSGSEKLLLTAREAARLLSITERTLYALTMPRGPIPVVRIGPRGVRFSADAIRRWIAKQEQVGAERQAAPEGNNDGGTDP